MNCKPGDLAITIYSKIPGNEGRLVEVIRLHGNDPEHGPRWWIRPCGSQMTTAWGEKKPKGTFPDKYLRPVSGLPEVETADDRIKEPA